MRPKAFVTVVGLLLAGTVALATGCKPKAGGACTGDQQACTDKTNGLFCRDGKFATMTCNGGCTGTGTAVSCVNDTATEGDGCSDEGSFACAVDKKSELECKDKAFKTRKSCKGDAGCTIAGELVTCDQSFADVSDPCVTEGNFACSADKAFVMKCTNSAFVAVDTCRGANGCSIQNDGPTSFTVKCDFTAAKVGDPCDLEGAPSCSTDKAQLLRCESAKYVAVKACGGANGCVVDVADQKVLCAGQVAGQRVAKPFTSTASAQSATGGPAATSTPTAKPTAAATTTVAIPAAKPDAGTKPPTTPTASHSATTPPPSTSGSAHHH